FMQYQPGTDGAAVTDVRLHGSRPSQHPETRNTRTHRNRGFMTFLDILSRTLDYRPPLRQSSTAARIPAAAGRMARTPHSGGKICAPYSLDTNSSRASAPVTVVTTTVRIGAERPRVCTARSTSSHSNAPISADGNRAA